MDAVTLPQSPPHVLPYRPEAQPGSVDVLAAGPALRVIALAPSAAEPPEPDEIGATLALAWDERGVRLEVAVRGHAFAEETDPVKGFLGTAVEVFLRDPERPERHVQVVVMPGVAADQPAVRIQTYDHRPPAVAAALGLITAIAERVRTTDGYRLALMVPLQSIGGTAAVGTRCKLRVLVNHRVPGGQRLQETWTGADLNNTQLLVCGPADSGGATIATAGWVQFPENTQMAVGAILPASAAGQTVVVRAGERVLAQAPAVLWLGRALARLRLPVAAVPPQVPLAICWQDQVVGMGMMGDLALNYRSIIPQVLQHPSSPYLLARAELVEFGMHGRFVFQGTRLPEMTIASAAVRRLTGALPVALRFLDGDGRTVTSAECVGRYGAVATISWPDGTSAVGMQTVVRIPDGEPQMIASSLLGRLAPMLMPGQSPIWPPGLPWLAELLREALWADAQAARILAALLEADDGSCRPDWQDRLWWHRVRAGAGIPLRYPRILRLPRSYDAEPHRLHPAVIYLHGGGGSYAPFDQRGPGDLHRYAERHADFPFVVCELQACDWWDSTALADSVAELIASHHVDPERIIMSGYSMGGYGTWQAILDTPELYAAAIPMGAGPGQPWEVQRCARVPIWCINGAADRTTTHAQASGMVAAVRAAGGKVRYTVQPGLDHLQSMTASLEEPGLWDWALAQRRGQPDPLPPL